MKRIYLLLKGEFTDLNTYIKAERNKRFGWIMASNIKKKETERVVIEAKVAKIEAIDKPVDINFIWYTKDLKKDSDNVAFAKKFIIDGLVASGVLRNDTRKCVCNFSDKILVSKDNPRVEVEIVIN